MPVTAGMDFETRTRQHRHELHVHSYRLLASFDEAEDAVQETLLRAWRARDRVDVGAGFRAWLYRIATNVCLDMLRRRSQRSSALVSPADAPWLQPYPDQVLDERPLSTDDPQQAAITRETIELAFLVALQALPPRQRAALLLRDVLGLTAVETAEALDTSLAASNSALQRARTTMRGRLPERRGDWSAPVPTADERELLDRFIDAHQRHDAEAAIAIAAHDLRVTMPPQPFCFQGREAIGPLLERAFGPDREGDWQLLPTMANRMPAAASYLRRPGDTLHRPFKLDVLRIEGRFIAEITTFGPDLFPTFGLPAAL